MNIPLKYNFFIWTLGVVLIACSEKPETANKNVFELARLAGRWESKDVKSHQIEEWQMVGPEELSGKGFVLESGDTTFIEFLSIRRDNGVLTYYAEGSEKDQREIIPFRLSHQTDDRIEFANPDYPFPKKIVYALKPSNQLQAFIEGPQGGKTVRVTFDFEKK